MLAVGIVKYKSGVYPQARKWPYLGICWKISSNNPLGILDLSRYVFIPCVPVDDPLGADIWQGIPFLHMGLGFHHVAFVHMSVGFILVSPYWQYVTVRLTPPVRLRNSSMNCILRRSPRGFSMNQYFGSDFSMSSIVFFASAIDLRALSLLGIYPRSPPAQFAPMEATLNPSHGGDAHIMSATGNNIPDTLRISWHLSGLNSGSLSTVYVSCPNSFATLLKDFVPQNSSIVFICSCGGRRRRRWWRGFYFSCFFVIQRIMYTFSLPS